MEDIPYHQAGYPGASLTLTEPPPLPSQMHITVQVPENPHRAPKTTIDTDILEMDDDPAPE